jgi:hypothetical protein
MSEGDEAQDLNFPRGERIRIIPNLTEELRRDGRLDQGAARMGDADGAKDLLARGTLEEVPIGPGADRADDLFIAVERGKDDDPNGARLAAKLPHHLDPIEVRHLEIEQQDIRLEFGRLAHCFGAGADLANDLEVRLSREHGREAIANHRVVVGQEDPDGV